MGISVSPCKRSASSIVLSVANSTFIVAHSRTVPCTATWCKDYFHCIKMDMERNTVQSNKRILSYAWVLSVLLPSKNVTSPFLRDLGVWSLDHGCTETFFLYKVVMLREQHIFCQDYSCKITVEGLWQACFLLKNHYVMNEDHTPGSCRLSSMAAYILG